ncbi:hypothetical protein C1645_781918 [Glomus cerebriforme]|uniref:Uncharacterized protein n=1 Tax=Glomus cerebriforme TaxID=658196 RepID=A0A397SKK3_9GLOM|nr:hypothetical protein C1645_781918 [Glomus cerebriforme]
MLVVMHLNISTRNDLNFFHNCSKFMMISEPFRYELQKYSRQYTSNISNKYPQWTHISQPSFIILENMLPTGIVDGRIEPVLKVVSDQNVLLESLNVSSRYADSLKAKALLRSPTIGIRYNHVILGDNDMPRSQETRKIQLKFKNVYDFESCASIIERYISCKRVNDPALNLHGELGINNQTQESTNSISQFRTNTTTYNNNMDLNRAQREPSVASMTQIGHQRISSQNLPSTSLSSCSSTFSNNMRSPIIQIDKSHSKLQNSQSNFNNNNIHQSIGKNNLSGSSDGQSTGIELHQSNTHSVQNQNQQSNTSNRQITSQINSSPHINKPVASTELRSSNNTGNEHYQEPIFYTNNQGMNVNPTITQNEFDEPSNPNHIPGMRHHPQISTYKIHKAQLHDQFSRQPQQQAYFQQQQNQYNQKQYQCKTHLQVNTNESRVQQNLERTQKINITNSQRTCNETNITGNENNLSISTTPSNINNVSNIIMRSSNTSNTTNKNLTPQSSHQSVFPNNRNVTNYSQPQFMSNKSISIPQTSQKNIQNVQFSCTPNQITINSIPVIPVQQVKIKQEKMEDSPTLHRNEEPYLIDLTMDDDDIEFDFQPTQAPVSFTQGKSQPNLINRSQFIQPIISQVHSQPINSFQSIDTSTLLSQDSSSSVMQISPHNTSLIHEGLQNLRNRPLSTIQLPNNNSIHLSESSVQKQHVPLPEDDAELQDWIVDILKDPTFPQFVGDQKNQKFQISIYYNFIY